MKEINTDNARKVTISLVKANIFSIVLMVASAVILIVPYCLIWGGEWRMESGEWRAESGEPFLVLSSSFLTPINGVIFLVAMLVGVVVHELIHGITWACFAPSGWKSISFGVIWKMLTPYCHCNEPMRPRPYILGALMRKKPVAGRLVADSCCLLPAVCYRLIWSIIFIAAASGDIWMAWLLRKERPDCTVLDHPSEAGFYVFE